MSAYELLDLSMSATNRIDAQWALYVTFHLAILGGIVYVERPLRWPEKLGGLVIYAGLAIFSYRILANQIDLLDTIYRDIAALASDPCCSGLASVRHVAADLEGGRFARSGAVTLVIHASVGLAVLVSVLLDRPEPGSSRR